MKSGEEECLRRARVISLCYYTLNLLRGSERARGHREIQTGVVLRPMGPGQHKHLWPDRWSSAAARESGSAVAHRLQLPSSPQISHISLLYMNLPLNSPTPSSRIAGFLST